MKILMMTEEKDLFYHFLLESLNNLNIPVGHAAFPVSEQDMQSFDPDIIIHNVKNISKINFKSVITISINELKEENCFSFKDKEAENFIRPFVKLHNEELEDHRYKSDVVYVGNPMLLPDCIAEIQADKSINFKILNNTAVPITHYCGSCNFDNYKKFFHMSKCSIVNKSDSDLSHYSFKLLDIIYAGGNPVLHKDDKQFIADLRDALDGKSFRDDFISKKEILNNHTNYDRMSEIFSKVGLNKLSKMILEGKGK
jgi:hypothetical protein